MQSISSLLAHVLAGGLVLDEVHSLAADVGPLTGGIHPCILLLHLISISLAIFPLGNLEQLSLARVDLHQLNPVSHTRQQTPSTLVLQQDMSR